MTYHIFRRRAENKGTENLLSETVRIGRVSEKPSTTIHESTAGEADEESPVLIALRLREERQRAQHQMEEQQSESQQVPLYIDSFTPEELHRVTSTIRALSWSELVRWMECWKEVCGFSEENAEEALKVFRNIREIEATEPTTRLLERV